LAEFEKKKVVRKAGGIAYDLTKPGKTYIYELARAEDGICFCCFDGERFFRLDKIEQFDHIILPPPEEKVTWSLPLLIEGRGNPPDSHPMFARQVWDGVYNFIYDHLDLSDERFYTYLTAWVFASWFQDKLSASPYPYFTGLKRTGKTRALEVLKALCFRAKGLAGVTGAAIRTNIRLLRPTLLIDEADFEDEEKRGELFSVLLSYRPDMYVERKNPKASGWEQLEVDPAFCFKAIASRKAPSTNLADRCVEIHMFYRSRPVKRIRSKASQALADKLRTELMEIRMRFYDKISDSEVVLGLSDDRVEELFIPPYLMAKTFAGEAEAQKIIELAKDVEKTFEREREESEEKDVVEALCLLLEEGKAEQKGEGKWIVPSSVLLDKVNEARHETMKMTAKQQAQILDRLGFERVSSRFGESKRPLKCVVVSKRILEHYMKLFNIKQQEEAKESQNQPAPQVTLTKENVERVFEALANASKLRGSATTEEIAMEAKLPVEVVKACLEALQREGRVYQPFPDWWKMG